MIALLVASSLTLKLNLNKLQNIVQSVRLKTITLVIRINLNIYKNINCTIIKIIIYCYKL